MQSLPTTTLPDPTKRAPLPEALRRDIASLIRSLPDDDLLELVGPRLADLVALRGGLAVVTPEEKPVQRHRSPAATSLPEMITPALSSAPPPPNSPTTIEPDLALAEAPRRPGRPCPVCVHPDREDIEAALTAGESGRAVALRNGLTPRALVMHRRKHTTIPAPVRGSWNRKLGAVERQREPRPAQRRPKLEASVSALTFGARSLAWFRRPRGIDLAGPGIQCARMADDVRRLVLARWRGNVAALLDPNDLVQEVYRRILRRNRRPCAWDPSRGSLSKYVYQVTTGAIIDMLKPAKRRAERELHGDPERLEEVAAPEPDPDDAPFDLDAAPIDPDERERFFFALCWLELTGKLPGPHPEPLWQRALKQRQAEQALAAKRQPERERLDPLDAEILVYVRSETAAGRHVPVGELAAMLGEDAAVVRGALARLEDAGKVERRGRGRSHGYWARTEAVPPVQVEPAPELPPEVPAELSPPEGTPSIPLGLELAAVEGPSPVAPAPWRHRRLNTRRLHASFLAAELAALTLLSPPSALSR